MNVEIGVVHNDAEVPLLEHWRSEARLRCEIGRCPEENLYIHLTRSRADKRSKSPGHVSDTWFSLDAILSVVEEWPTIEESQAAWPANKLAGVLGKNCNDSGFVAAALRKLGVLVEDENGEPNPKDARPSYRATGFDRIEFLKDLQTRKVLYPVIDDRAKLWHPAMGE